MQRDVSKKMLDLLMNERLYKNRTVASRSSSTEDKTEIYERLRSTELCRIRSNKRLRDYEPPNRWLAKDLQPSGDVLEASFSRIQAALSLSLCNLRFPKLG